MANSKLALAAAVLIACASMAWAKVGLSSKFVDVVIEGLKLGRAYNLREIKGVPYTVINRGDADSNVRVEPIPPTSRELMQGYEPIPDPSWIQITPPQHLLRPGGSGFSDIVINIPDDPSLVGRHFQAMVWSHAVDEGFLAAGIRSRLRFSVGAGPETLKKEKVKKAMMTLNFDIWPSSLYLSEVPAGQKYNAKKVKKTFKITNRSDSPVRLILKSAAWDNSLNLPEGYVAAENPEWLELKPNDLTIKANRVKDVQLILNVPKEHAGKKLAFRIVVEAGDGLPLSVQNFVYVQTQEIKGEQQEGK